MFLLFSLIFIKWKCADRKCTYEKASINVPLDYNDANSNYISLKLKRIKSSDLHPPVIVLSNGAGSSNIDMNIHHYSTSFKNTTFYFVGYRGIDSNLTFNDKQYKPLVNFYKNATKAKDKLIKIAKKTSNKLNLANFWVDQRADDVIEFIKQENLPKCNLFAVGYSGSLIAQQLIGRYPEYFIRCAIVDSSIPEENKLITNNTLSDNSQTIEEITENDEVETETNSEEVEDFISDENENIYEDEPDASSRNNNKQNQNINPDFISKDPHYFAVSRLIERYKQKCLQTFGRTCMYQNIKWIEYDDIPDMILLLVTFKKDNVQWSIDHEMRNPETVSAMFDLLQSVNTGSKTSYMGFQSQPGPGKDYKWLDIAMHLCAQTNDQTLLYPTGLNLICPYLPTIKASYDFNYTVPILLVNGEFDMHSADETKEYYQKHMQNDLLTTLYLPNSVSLYSFQRDDVNSAIEKFFVKGSKSFNINRFIEIKWSPPISIAKSLSLTYKGGFIFTTVVFVYTIIKALSSSKKTNNKKKDNQKDKQINNNKNTNQKNVQKSHISPKLRDRKRITK